MKKFIFFFIIMVSIMTLCLTRSKKIDESNVVTEEELTQYKETLLGTYDKYGYNLTEKDIEQKIQSYKEKQTNIAKLKAEGMDLKKALKVSLIACSIFCIVIFVIYHLKNAQYNEMFGSSYNSDNKNDQLKGIRHFFFGRWF